MSQNFENTESTASGWLDILPALTLVVVLALFSLQALSAPPAQVSAHPDSEQLETVATELPKLGHIAPFQFTERSGKQINQDNLKGKIWLADFIFTTCPAECPLMSKEMEKIQQKFGGQERFQLVSFTVDPETDTPEILRQYAQKWSASADGWWFLTGPRKALYDLAQNSFKLTVESLQAKSDEHHHNMEHHHDSEEMPAGATAPSSPFMHSQKFVLVDDQLRIRGYYESLEPEAVQRLITKDIPALLQQP